MSEPSASDTVDDDHQGCLLSHIPFHRSPPAEAQMDHSNTPQHSRLDAEPMSTDKNAREFTI